MALFGGGKKATGVTQEQVLQALRSVQDSGAHQDIVALGLVGDVAIGDGQVSFTLTFTDQPALARAEIHSAARRVVSQLPGVTGVKAQIASNQRRAPAAASPGSHEGHGHEPAREELIPGVKNTIAISSGKGGVGKSTVAVNLALTLRETGASVGLIDADVYGPNIPLMMGARGRPGMFNNRIIPVQAYDVKIISIGFFVKEGDAVVWRGPMIHSAIQQFLKDVEWGELDYLVFDMPPGTGDAQLSLSQAIPLSGAVMVTTPQDVSLLDVRKGLAMFQKMKVPLLGVVENMAGFACPHCQQTTPIFGEGGGEKLAREFGVPVLGSIPLDLDTRVGGDTGVPIVVSRPDSPQAEAFRQVAKSVLARLAAMPGITLPAIS